MQVVDPARAAHEVQDWNSHLYNAVQIALRSVIATLPAEALLGSRLNIGQQLIEIVRLQAEKIGVAVHAIEIKDVMLPGELKRAFAEVLKARQEAQAAQERARGESAALRNLANAARLLENNPALHNLRLMQSISTAGASGNTLVMGVPTGFVPLKNGATRTQGDTPPSENEQAPAQGLIALGPSSSFRNLDPIFCTPPTIGLLKTSLQRARSLSATFRRRLQPPSLHRNDRARGG